MRKIHLANIFIMFCGSLSAMQNPDISGVANQPAVVVVAKAPYSLGKEKDNEGKMKPELSDESLASKLPHVKAAIEQARLQKAAEVRTASADSRTDQLGCCGMKQKTNKDNSK